MASFFLCILLFRVDFRINLCFPETETARQPRISAASDAAALRFRRGDDAPGVLPVRDSLPLVYISGFIAATALEYVTGAVMERLFKVRYWDYSSQPFQLHGYICLSSSIAWGFLTILMTDVIHDPIARTVLAVPPVILLICDFVISVLFTADAYESIKAAPLGSYAGSYDEAQSRYRRAPVQDRTAA